VAGYSDIAQRFLDLHVQGRPLLLANAWDRGSARVLADAGFHALATTSSGHAATLGKPDGAVTREEAIAHAGDIAAATDLPLSADLENGFGDEPEAVAETVRLALEVGLAGCSIEDCARDAETIYERERAIERVAAAAEAAHAGAGLVLTARSENHIRGNPDLEDTIERLRGYQEAGADVLYAPGLKSIEQIRELVAAVDRPVNVLALPGVPAVADLAAAGVSRVSVGGGFAFTALGALATAARELIDAGTYGFSDTAKLGSKAARSAFEP
jgi:2-methylisocitrate lyase-like PEP mutase family enzyme